MNISELLEFEKRRPFHAAPEADGLTEQNALAEADLLDVRLRSVAGAVDLLFDVRGALQFRIADTAVLSVGGLQLFEWHRDSSFAGRREAHRVMVSEPRVVGNSFEFNVWCLRGWGFLVRGLSAEFFVGCVPGLLDPPPNFVEDSPEVIEAELQNWRSEFELEGASFIDPFSGAATQC